MKHHAFLLALPFASAVLIAAPARAQGPSKDLVGDDVTQTKEASKAEEGQEDGWYPVLDLGLNFSLTHSQDVVDKPDGVGLALGANIMAALMMLQKDHEWSTSIGWQFSLTRSPDIGEFSKGQDSFYFQTRYLYSFPKPGWLGVFAKFRMESALLPGWKVSLDETEVVKRDPDGDEIADGRYDVTPGDRINLTGPFSPVLFKESLGLMATPVDKKAAHLEIGLGLGGHQLAVMDAFRLDDDDSTAGELELTEIAPYEQVGVALDVYLDGQPHEVVGYGFVAELMQPFYTSNSQGMKGFELFNVRMEALLRLQLTSLLMLDFKFEAKRYPLVIDEWQLLTSLLVTFHFAYPMAKA